MKTKIIFLCLFIILLIGFVSSAEWDNTKDYNFDTGVLTVKNTFGLGDTIGTAKLNTPHIYRVGAGYQKVAEFEIQSNKDYLNAIKEFKFYDLTDGNKKINRDIDLKYKVIKEITVYETSSDCYSLLNKTIICDNNKILGQHTEEKEEWIKLTPADLKAGNILTIGIFTEVQVGDKIEWIPNIFGVDVEEWAEWTADLNVGLVDYYKMDVINSTLNGTYNNITQTYDLIIFNSSAPAPTNYLITGKIGNAFNFSSSLGCAGTVRSSGVVNTTRNLNTTATINLWIKPNVTNIADSYPFFAGTTLAGGSDKVVLEMNASGYIGVDEALGTTNQSNKTLTAGNWYMATLLMNRDGDGKIYLYINGELGLIKAISPTNYGAVYLHFPRFNCEGGFGIDEIGFWNRTLTPAEITQLYNGGSGMTYSTDFDNSPTVTLNSPINAYNSSSQSITFNCTASDDLLLTNVSLYINSTRNQTNTSTYNNTPYIFTKTISDGFYNWSCDAYDNSSQRTVATYRNFTIDSLSPYLNGTYPYGNVGYHKKNTNITLNWNVSDINIDDCWYSYKNVNVTVTCSANTTSFNLTDSINRNLTLWANDTLGNRNYSYISWNYTFFENARSYENDTVEGATTGILINGTIPDGESISSIILNYGGTNYSSTLVITDSPRIIGYNNLTVPLVNANTNETFFWFVKYSGGSYINTSSNNQTVYNLTIDDCTAGTTKLLIYNLFEEEKQTYLNESGDVTYIEVDLTLYDGSYSTSILNYSIGFNETNPAEICLNINLSEVNLTLDAQARYSDSGYSEEFYHIQNSTINDDTMPLNISLYDLNSSVATSFLITYKDDAYLPVGDALIDISRKYVSEGTFKTIEIPKTDQYGQAIAHLDTNNVIYTFTIKRYGQVLATFQNVAVICENPTIYDCKINLNEVSSASTFSDYSSIGNLIYDLNFNETSRALTLTFTTSDGSSKKVLLNATKYDRIQNVSVCNDELTSSSGVLTCTVPGSYGNVTVIAEVSVDDEIINTKVYTIDESASDVFGTTGIIIAFILIITLVMMSITSTIGILIGAVIGFIMVIVLNLVESSSPIGVGSSIMWLVIAIGIIIYKISQREK